MTDGPPAARFRVVPTAIVPPPAGPEAVTFAPGARVTVPLLLSAMAPPVVPAAPPSAVTLPVTITSPPAPAITTRPVFAPTLLAAIVPPAFTNVCTTPSTALALSTTVPPLAEITPSLVISALVPFGAVVTWPVTLIPTMPSPYRSSAKVSAPASTTEPSLAWMVPALRTCGATRVASP